MNTFLEILIVHILTPKILYTNINTLNMLYDIFLILVIMLKKV